MAVRHKEKILELRAKGWSYNQIAKELNCNKSTISYHCGPDQKEKHRERKRRRRNRELLEKKIWRFRTEKKGVHVKSSASDSVKRSRKVQDFQRTRLPQNTTRYNSLTFNYRDVLEKFGAEPVCYLTGRRFKLDEPDTYQFDHIVPVSREGDGSLENLGLVCPEGNAAKGQMTAEEFLSFCREVLEHHGYTVSNDGRSRS